MLADDLIWASRLIEAVRRAGGTPVRLSSEAELATVLEADAGAELRAGEGDRALVGVVIDLVGRRYDGVAAVERSAKARKPVIAVAQHDDLVTRKRALSGGRVARVQLQQVLHGWAATGRGLAAGQARRRPMSAGRRPISDDRRAP